jgi:hypothetical protein
LVERGLTSPQAHESEARAARSSAGLGQEVAEELLKKFLSGRDIECPRCAYNLRDLPGDRCPECGDRLALSVNTVEPRLTALITGLAGLCMGVGFNGLLLTLMLIINGRINPHAAGAALSGLIIEGAALGFWLGCWKSIRAISRAAQWRWTVLCWLLIAADVVYFALMVR